MATIKSYTDISQAKILANILTIESADMTYYACVKDWRGNPIEPKWGKPANLTKEELALPCSNFQKYEYVHCWSLAALLNVLPNGIVMNKDSQSGRYHFSFKYIETYVTADNPVDACYKMILMLHEIKML